MADRNGEEVKWRQTHMCMDIRGALRNTRNLVGSVKNDDGRKLTRHEIEEWLMDELAKGRKVLPLGKPCDGFDYQDGCPGHDVQSPQGEPK